LALMDSLTAPSTMYPYWFHALMKDPKRADVPL